MTTLSPIVQQGFKNLKAANAELLRSMARQKRARAALAAAEQKLALAKRNVELYLQAVQPELPSAGVLDASEASVAEHALDTP